MKQKKILLMLAMLCTMLQGAWSQDIDVWDGHTKTKPQLNYRYDLEAYTVFIRTGAELAWVRDHWKEYPDYMKVPLNESYFYLEKDLDMSAESWIPLGNDNGSIEAFMGVFEGQGHTIRIEINNSTSENCQGLIAENRYIIRNLHVTGKIKVGNARMVGAIVGDNYGLIKNCWVSADVESSHYSSNDADLGGIAGWNESKAKIAYCCMTGNVTNTGKNYGVGGIAGSNDGILEHCAFYGSVSVEHSQDNKYVGDQDNKMDGMYDEFNQSEYDAASDMEMYRKAFKYPYYIRVLTVGRGSVEISAGGETGFERWHPGETVTVTQKTGKLENVYIKNSENKRVDLQGSSEVNHSFWFVMPSSDITITAVFAGWPRQGAGTESDPYIISKAEDWEMFAQNVNEGTSYSGQYVKLTSDISTSVMVGTDANNSFKGMFDGDGHTLTFTKGSASEVFGGECCAPFRYTSGATIRNLKVAGDIYTSKKFGAGLISRSYGTTNITDCQVSTVIHSSVNGDGTHGGFVAMPSGTLNISGCMYDGRLFTTTSTTHCGGFVGWHNSATISVENSLYVPNANFAPAAGETTIDHEATFVRGGSPSITGCYYTEAMGTAQGVQAYTNAPAGEIAEQVTLAIGNCYILCTVSGVANSYGLTDSPSITPVVKNMNQTTLTFGTDYTATLNGNEVASLPISMTTAGEYNLTLTGKGKYVGSKTFNIIFIDNLKGAGTEADPYIITDSDDWDKFAQKVNDGISFSSNYIKLTTDISVSTMVGIDDAKSFQGTFDGDGHKLTFNNGTAESPFNEEYCAPFRHVKNATIKNIHVDGTIYTAAQKAAGVVGESHGALTITNSRSSIAITGSKSGDGTYGGFVATLSGANNTILIDGCVFDGSFATTNGTTNCGGFIGWPVYNRPTITNSLMMPSSVDAGMLINTFARWHDGYEPTITNCYFVATANLPTNQGKQKRTVTAGDEYVTVEAVKPVGNSTATYSVSGITTYAQGITCGGTFYFGSGDAVILQLSHTAGNPQPGAVYGYKASAGTFNGTNLVMPDGDVTISVDFETIITDWANANTGSKDDPYIINNPQNLDLLAQRVKEGNTYEGKYFRLANNIAYSYTTAWNDTASVENNYVPIGDNKHYFKGDFDGNGYAISGIRITKTSKADEDSELGIFGRVDKGGHIHDVILADTRITGQDNVAGIVGAIMNGKITNCHVAATVNIHSVNTTFINHAGIAGLSGMSTISHCTSAVVMTHINTCNNNAGIVASSLADTVSDNLVIGAIIPALEDNSHSAICSMNIGSTLERNYYTACTIAGTANATGVGTADIFTKTTKDVTKNDGAVPALRDNADNTNAIALMSALPTTIAGQKVTYPVALDGRTLYKDGAWNTICLPFNVVLAGSPFEGAVARPLSAASISGSTLNLEFGNAVDELVAGTPYIIKWESGDDIENPVFTGVTIDATDRSFDNGAGGDERVRFIGTYKNTIFGNPDLNILLMGSDNNLYYPIKAASIGAQRAYFKIGSEGAAQARIASFNIGYGDSETTGVGSMVNVQSSMFNDTWYSLDGRKLQGKPTQKGVYINNGRKVIIK